MTEYMLKDEYEQFVILQDKFDLCLKQCGIEIFLMRYGHEPEGEFCPDWEMQDGDKYLVQFEMLSCCECSMDSVYVPVRYTFDPEYRSNYDDVLKKERVDDELRIQQQKESCAKRIEHDERAEYTRLKAKYGAK